MCKHRIKTHVLNVDSSKQAAVRLQMYWRPVAILDTNTHTKVPCVVVDSVDGNVLSSSDDRRHLFDTMAISDNYRQASDVCVLFPKLSGDVVLQLPSHARQALTSDLNPYILVYEETHD